MTFVRFYRYFRASGYPIGRAVARAWAKAREPNPLPYQPTTKGNP